MVAIFNTNLGHSRTDRPVISITPSPYISYFDKKLFIVSLGAPKHVVQVLARLEQRFWSYSLGHFREITLQEALLKPIIRNTTYSFFRLKWDIFRLAMNCTM